MREVLKHPCVEECMMVDIGTRRTSRRASPPFPPPARPGAVWI